MNIHAPKIQSILHKIINIEEALRKSTCTILKTGIGIRIADFMYATPKCARAYK